ncbi:protein-disulfide reductase DsbD domain-containing protein [Rhodovulum imhoffii]|nr:protein-disulfide reductase DsbD domain-containing protein [Rhodovulum imhoffii]
MPARAEPPLRGSLVPAPPAADGTPMAGLRLDLEPGWKTYWRIPGEAGIPPRFDWSASENLKGVRIHWPRPILFTQNGMRSLGYEEKVVLPLELTPANPDAPMHLRLRIGMGVCKEICMPLTLELSARIPADTPPAALNAWMARRPLPAGAAHVKGVKCALSPARTGLRLTAEIEMPSLGGQETAIFELRGAGAWLSDSPTRRTGNRLSAGADLSGDTLIVDRSALRITVLGNDTAVEILGCSGG